MRNKENLLLGYAGLVKYLKTILSRLLSVIVIYIRVKFILIHKDVEIHTWTLLFRDSYTIVLGIQKEYSISYDQLSMIFNILYILLIYHLYLLNHLNKWNNSISNRSYVFSLFILLLAYYYCLDHAHTHNGRAGCHRYVEP